MDLSVSFEITAVQTKGSVAVYFDLAFPFHVGWDHGSIFTCLKY